MAHERELSGEGGEAVRMPYSVESPGLPTIRLHDIRPHMGDRRYAVGCPPKVVQERLGHATVAITLQTWSHVIPVMHDKAAATVPNLITASRVDGGTPLCTAR